MEKIILDKKQEELFLKLTSQNLTLSQICNKLHKDPDVIRRLARDYNIIYLQEHYKYTEEQKQLINDLYENTNLNIGQIIDKVKLPDVRNYIWDTYTSDYRQNRHKKLLAAQKMGKSNPMFNKKGELHPNYKGLCSDGKGYLTVIRPDWYEGRQHNTKRVFYHHVVMCEHLGIKCIPKGFVVHHIDFNKTNNDINNLALMTIQAHSKLHNVLRKN